MAQLLNEYKEMMGNLQMAIAKMFLAQKDT
jgi:hypothetical protein